MAVFTPVADADVQELLRAFDPQARLLGLEGIGTGIENTNYFARAHLQGRPQTLVLTLFETLQADQVGEYARVMQWWSAQGFPVPAPLLNPASPHPQQLSGKPALLLPKLPGHHALTPSPAQCHQMGALLARMHLVAPQAPFQRPVERTLSWMREQQRQLQGLLPADSQQRLATEIDHYEACLPLFDSCTQGLVHGDLFRDNVLFEGESISGLIDFYHSGRETLLFDLAVVANDWCPTHQGMDGERLEALLDGYQGVRPWSSAEAQAWPQLRRLAALRFWLARLVSRYLPGYQRHSAQGDATKPPEEMEQLLVQLIK